MTWLRPGLAAAVSLFFLLALAAGPPASAQRSPAFWKNSCLSPWGSTVQGGQSVNAYLSSSGCCVSESRTCEGGTLSGTYTNQSCSSTGSCVFEAIVSSGNLGGVAGADATCAAAASSAGLPGAYLAWVATGASDDPESRLPHSSSGYYLPSGTKIADNWTDLTDGTVDAAPMELSDGTSQVLPMFTGVTINGTGTGVNNCSNWTSSSSGVNGGYGASNMTSSAWTNSGVLTMDCSTGIYSGVAGIYCFQCAGVPTGGTITAKGDGYTLHTFTSSGTFNPVCPRDVEVLVVGGGGGGGGGVGAMGYPPGGGGGGGMLEDTAFSVNAQSYTVTVGGGGAGGFGGARGTNGGNSVFSTMTAVGGGGGGATNLAGLAGGSGGGGAYLTSGGTGTGGQGNDGGPGSTSGAGGGGGAGFPGSMGSAFAGGDGGGGGASSILGPAVYYAGGGGGSGPSPFPGAGGMGGGGAGAVSSGTSNGTAGTANTGGGGGGGGNGGSTSGGAGGSGVVIIKSPAEYKLVFVTSTSYNGSFPTVGVADSNCSTRAAVAGLSGSYKAWIASSASDDPESTFTRSTVPYILPDGTKIADDWADLTDGTLDAGINKNEFGADASGVYVWSGVVSAGTYSATYGTCSSWMSTSGSGDTGLSGQVNSNWSFYNSGFGLACTNTYRLYCFQQ